MIVWAVADRLLDIIGLGTLLYWTVRGTRWFYRRSHGETDRRPRAVRLND